MEFGIVLNTCHKRNFLIEAGYRQVPNHCEAHIKYDEQWISNVDNFGTSHFPRFHIIKVGKQWFIHRDYYNNGDNHRTTIKKCPETLKEIKRLNKLYATKSKTTS